ncbi:DMT family transporter [Actinoallomurus rhizosphaericola]|uniref:DMT family transporter n=1 Tax=Actinoallomurus rhizosphaericola TaxID=2952536 RepID=UPI0020938C53|nr:DMT family transporter [Actinoallomurus rhizosphaericola]MCO5997979.1 DMT family transporter [Actinoallomurus rhizosphaericola]
MERSGGSAGWLPGFVVLSIIWGSSFALIKVAVDAGVAPLWVALWRCLFGLVALGAVCVARRASMPRSPRVWAHALVVAALLNSVPFALFSYAETRVSSVVAGVWNATTPLTTLLFAVAVIPEERPTPRRSIGLATGFCGVLLVLGVWRGLDGGTLGGSLACLGATACYGAGFTYTRRFFAGGGESAVALSAVQILCATAELALVAPAAAGPPSWPGPAAVAALAGLGAVGTGLAYIINLGVIRAAGPTVASTVTYLTPLWSTLLGAALLGEPLGWNTLTGGLLIVAGVVVARSPRRGARAAVSAPGSPGPRGPDVRARG